MNFQYHLPYNYFQIFKILSSICGIAKNKNKLYLPFKFRNRQTMYFRIQCATALFALEVNFFRLPVLGPIKNVPVFQEGGSTPAPPTLPVIRVVLLHTERFVESFSEPTVSIMISLFIQPLFKFHKLYIYLDILS